MGVAFQNISSVFREAASNACSVGVLVRKDGKASFETLQKLQEAKALTFQRGGFAADGKTTDGDGLETNIPQDFFRAQYNALDGQNIDQNTNIAIGQLYLPHDEAMREQAWKIVEEELAREGYDDPKRRNIPYDLNYLGPIGQEVLPHPAQILIPQKPNMDVDTREKELALIHARIEKRFLEEGMIGEEPNTSHICSFSGERVIYKARTDPRDKGAFWKDYSDERFEITYGILHNRFTTAGQTRHENIQPLPHGTAHNGTITTERGAKNAMHIHEQSIAADFGENGQDLIPFIRPGASDSAGLDIVAGMMRHGGRSLPSIKMALLAKANSRDADVPQSVKDARRFHDAEMEKWDGPALVVLTDGRLVLVTLDANGNRPATIQETGEYLFIGSEFGMVGFDVKHELENTGVLKPGQMIMMDTLTGEVKTDRELEAQVATEQDYAALAAQIKDFEFDQKTSSNNLYTEEELAWRMRLAGYAREDNKSIMAMLQGKEQVSSMGNTAQMPAASPHYHMGEHFFSWHHNQIVAPAHNAMLDGDMMDLSADFSYPRRSDGSIREEMWRLPNHFVLRNAEFDTVVDMLGDDQIKVIDCTFDTTQPDGAMQKALEHIEKEALEAARAGRHIILTDEHVGKNRAPVWMQQATGKVHTALNEAGLRGDVGLIVKSAESHTSHGPGVLKALGATAVVPYLAEQKVAELHRNGLIVDKKGKPVENTLEKALDAYYAAMTAGIKVIMQRTCTLRAKSMQGALQVTANGLDREMVGELHPGVSSPISGIGYDEIERRIRENHKEIFEPTPDMILATNKNDGKVHLLPGGRFAPTTFGEKHAQDGPSIYQIQAAVDEDDFEEGHRKWKEYSNYVHGKAAPDKHPIYPRDHLVFKELDTPISLDEVQSEEGLYGLIVGGAMSIGAINEQTHRALHEAGNELGFETNTGEGGYPQALLGTKFQPKVVQVSTNGYGLRPELLASADIIEIKFGQGAKSGEGGQMPAEKVTKEIAKNRFVQPYTEQKSSPLHMDMRSIEDLKQKLKVHLTVNPKAEMRVKIVGQGWGGK